MLHPIIHLGFGVEFQQPAITAEALSETAVHENWIKGYLLSAERQASEQGRSEKSLVELLEEARANKKLRESVRFKDGNKIRDGVLARAKQEMLAIASQFTVSEEELDRRTAEMINFAGNFRLTHPDIYELIDHAGYFTGAAQRPPKQVKFDFFLMHCINSSIFFYAFLCKSWISKADKARLLEWKGRLDLVVYVSRGSPELVLDEIQKYKPKKPRDWKDLFHDVSVRPDDGHASKFVRALKNGAERSKPYDDRKEFKLKADDWLKYANAGTLLSS